MLSDESIYCLIPITEAPKKFQATYRSKYPKHLADTKLRAKGSFGPGNGKSKPESTRFLKKHAKEPILPNPTNPTNPKQRRKPSVPNRAEKPVMGLVSSKNFITSNAIENILSEPKKKQQDELKYTAKSDYGKVPRYLGRNKQRVQKEKAQVQEYIRQQNENTGPLGSTMQMQEDERQDLLKYLKEKWAVVNSAYQKMTFTLDTPAKQKRKEKYEKDLLSIEQDIQLLDKGTVFIAA